MGQSAAGSQQSAIRSIIIGTAGHIDHGKSALVRALTGTDPDRLPEEKRRGITIDLGFADLQLGNLRLGFVDVPGHERFVKNMLAGAHGIDVVALVVAADEGVMPQTREHFDICRLLGVKQGLIVITKSDLVDPELLLLVKDEISELVRNSFLEEAPIVSVSSKTGTGIAELKATLTELSENVPPRASDQVTRLPVDRVFSMKGFGAVVTGTLISGVIGEGDELELLPPRIIARVRGVQVHGKSVPRAQAGQRTAVNLAGVDVGQIERGMVLAASHRLRATQIIDTTVRVLPTAPRSLRSRTRVRMHLGAAEVLGRIQVLQETGEIEAGGEGIVQIRLEAPIVALHSDRFVIRSYSPQETIAGGIVLHPFANKHRGRDLARTQRRLTQLAISDRVERFKTFVEFAGESGARLHDVGAATGWNDTVLQAVAAEAQSGVDITNAGGVYLSRGYFEEYCRSTREEVARLHQRDPLARGVLRETLRERVFAHAAPEIFSSVVAALESQKILISEKDTVRAFSHSVDLTEEDRELREKLADAYRVAGVEAPTTEEVMARIAVPPSQRQRARKILQLLIDEAKIVRVQGEMMMDRAIAEELKQKLLEYAAGNNPDRLIDVATFKEIAGVSRKYAIPLLEYFDRERVTRRAGDKRVILK